MKCRIEKCGKLAWSGSLCKNHGKKAHRAHKCEKTVPCKIDGGKSKLCSNCSVRIEKGTK